MSTKTQKRIADERLGDRPEWILRLLYAPTKSQEGVPIVGMTRLMKGCFLIHKKMEEEFGVETSFDFHPNRFGPLDEKVYDSVEELESQSLISVEESKKYDGKEFSLT